MKKISLVLFVLFTTSHLFAAGKEEKIWKPIYNKPNPIKEKATTPMTIEKLAPAFFSSINSNTVKLTWSESVGAKLYHLQIAEDANFKWLVVDKNLFEGTNFEFTNFKTGMHYFWRVAGVNPDNKESYIKGPFSSSMFEVSAK
jgi:hypothetical protein